MNFSKKIYLIILLTSFTLPLLAHTTIHTSQKDKNGIRVKILHFHPNKGTDLMGLKLGGKDEKEIKSLESVYFINKGKKRDLAPFLEKITLKNATEKAPELAVTLNRTTGTRGGGDYIVVSKHTPHLKPWGVYIQLVTKSFENIAGMITDWPNRVLDSLPEIIPLVSPTKISVGDIFRAYVVDKTGKTISHAKINIEYLNYKIENDSILSNPLTDNEEMIDQTIFTNSVGEFSFIPKRSGLWSFTLMDADAGAKINGKELKFNSLISIKVKR